MLSSEKLLQKVKNDYNKIAEHFSQTRQFSWPEFSDFKPYLQNGQRILDLGCGNGRLYFSFLKDYNLEYHGIDLSERLVVLANKQLSITHDSLVSFNVGDITKLPYTDNSFDIIFCVATFHHLPSKELRLKALREMKRVLKPGGYLLMTNWYWWDRFPWKYYFSNFYQKQSCKDLFIPWKNSQRGIITKLYYHAFTRNELKRLIKKSGLRIKKLFFKGRDGKAGKKSRKNIITICKK